METTRLVFASRRREVAGRAAPASSARGSPDPSTRPARSRYFRRDASPNLRFCRKRETPRVAFKAAACRTPAPMCVFDHKKPPRGGGWRESAEQVLPRLSLSLLSADASLPFLFKKGVEARRTRANVPLAVSGWSRFTNARQSALSYRPESRGFFHDCTFCQEGRALSLSLRTQERSPFSFSLSFSRERETEREREPRFRSTRLSRERERERERMSARLPPRAGDAGLRERPRFVPGRLAVTPARNSANCIRTMLVLERNSSIKSFQ